RPSGRHPMRSCADRVRFGSMTQFGLRAAFGTVIKLLADIRRLGFLMLRSRTQLAAENVFLRKQLAMNIERQVNPRRADHATRIALVGLSQLVDWRQLLVIVKPDTLIRWHCAQPRTVHPGVRFLRRGHRQVSRDVRVRCSRSRYPTHRALEYDGTSDG